MGLIALILVAGVVLAVMLLTVGTRGYEDRNIVSAILGLLLSAVLAIGIITYLVTAFSWFAAEQKAAVINREFGTAYTQEEIFWAEDVIDTIREIKRNRFELNGDLFRDAPEQKP